MTDRGHDLIVLCPSSFMTTGFAQAETERRGSINAFSARVRENHVRPSDESAFAPLVRAPFPGHPVPADRAAAFPTRCGNARFVRA